MTRAILFDLDGHYLPIEFEEFFARYVESIVPLLPRRRRPRAGTRPPARGRDDDGKCWCPAKRRGVLGGARGTDWL